MLHPNFIFAFTATLALIAGLAVFGGVCFGLYWLYQLWKRLPAGLKLSEALRSFTVVVDKVYRVQIENATRFLRTARVFLTSPLTRLRNRISEAWRRTGVDLMTAGSVLICLLPIVILPFLVLWIIGLPSEIIAGITAAGAVVGLALAPVSIWKTKGSLWKKARGGALTVVGSSYLVLFAAAVLFAMAID